MFITFLIVGALLVITVGGIFLVIKDRHRQKDDSIECLFEKEQRSNFDSERNSEPRKIPVAQIVGSIGRCSDFDSSFRFKKKSPNDRFLEIKKIMKKSLPMPPVILYRFNKKYYVMDGHHRVAVAKFLSHDIIVAIVINIEMKQ
jgi:hypothetical protein